MWAAEFHDGFGGWIGLPLVATVICLASEVIMCIVRVCVCVCLSASEAAEMEKKILILIRADMTKLSAPRIVFNLDARRLPTVGYYALLEKNIITRSGCLAWVTDRTS